MQPAVLGRVLVKAEAGSCSQASCLTSHHFLSESRHVETVYLRLLHLSPSGAVS